MIKSRTALLRIWILLCLLGLPVLAAADVVNPREFVLADSGYPYDGVRLRWGASCCQPVFTGVDTVLIKTSGRCVPLFPTNRLTAEIVTDFTIVELILMPGVTNVATLPTLDLRFDDCVPRSQEIGLLVVSSDGTPGSVCLNEDLKMWRCDGTPAPLTTEMEGCCSGCEPRDRCYANLCPVDVIVPESWARVRAKYR